MKKRISFIVFCLLAAAYFQPITAQETLISNQITYSNETRASGDIVIEYGAELVITGILRVAPGNAIIIRPGGKLTVDGGVITSMGSGQMWKGILVTGNAGYGSASNRQGVLELKNGAVIEHALNAVRLWDGVSYTTAGGIIHAQNATFRNNREAVEFLKYRGLFMVGVNDIIIEGSYFRQCTFTINNNNYFSANGVSFSRHVYLWEIDNIQFKGCTFKNETTGISSSSSLRGRGIHALDAKFNISAYCTIPGNYSCIGAVYYPSFNGFYYGIYATSSAGNTSPFSVTQARFENNYYGIRASGIQNAVITHSTFIASFTGAVRGIYLTGCTGYKIRENSFTGLNTQAIGSRTSYGIQVLNSGTATNYISTNVFKYMGYGIYVSGSNGDNNIDGTGLSFDCNDFIENRYGIYVADNAVIRVKQGGPDAGSNNVFQNNQMDFRANTQNIILYYYSPLTNHAPVTYSGNLFLSGNAGRVHCYRSIIVNSNSLAENEQRNEIITESRSQEAETNDQNKVSVDVFPNPVQDILQINLQDIEEADALVEFFDVTGKRVYSEKIRDYNNTLQLGHLTAGIYFYRISTPGQIIAQDKIVKN